MDNEKNPVDQQKRESNKKKLYITLSLILLLLISLAIVLPIVLTNKEQKIVALDFISSSSFVYGEDISNQDIIITYEDNSDEKIKFNQLEINKDDLAKLKNVGEYIITVTYKDFSTELTITILPADFTNLEKEKMLIDNKFFEYDGENKHFLTSYLPEGAVALYSVNNEDDFKIDYSITEIGTYTIYVKVSKQNFNDFVFSFDIEIIDTTIKIDGFEENEGVFTKRVSNDVNEIGIYSLIKTSDINAKVKIYLDEMLTQEVQDTILLENLQTKIFIKLYFDNNDLIKIYQVIVTKNDLFTINFYLKDTLLGNEFIEEGDYLQQPSYTVEGYNIVGWKINEDLISFPYKPNSDIDLYAEYSLINYSIRYNLQEGIISEEKQFYTVEDETFTLPTPTKEGYDFIGWTWEGQEDPQIIVAIEKGTTGNKEYTANWIEKTYFISKGTTSNGSFDIVSEGKYNEEISLTVSPEDGYKVIQTYYVLDGQEQKITIINQKFNMPASNIVVYVVFEKVDYTLEGVQTSHGTFSLSKTGANLGDEITINVTPDNGYEVFKVYYEIVGDNIENQIENLKFIMPAGNIKVYVEFNAIIYTISYELNDGQIVGQKENYTIEDETFALPTPTKEGYEFIGWTWEGQIEPQKVVTISQGTTGNKEYTANWEIKKYTVTIQENDAYEIIKEQDNVEHGSDYKFKIILNEAYTQSNVVVKNDEEIIELGEDGFYTITNVTKDVEILIEGIVKNKYKITWQNYDGSELEVDENVEHGTIPNYDGETPIKESDEQYDYIFDGWNTQITAAKEDKVYVAIFQNQLRKYTITFGENILIEKISGGNINSGEQVDYGTQIKIIYQESLGYRKVNFKVNGNEVENNYITMVNGNINIEFIEEAISYSILYNLNGGQIEGQRESYTIEDETFALKEPIKEGYEFVGWTWDGQDVPQKVVTINKGTTGDKEYTANWDLIEYTITYFLNEGMMSGQVKTYTIEDETFVLPTPTKRGYEFLGWTGTDLSGQNMIVEIIKGSTGNREYTANWEINQYTYTFYNNNEVYYTQTIDYGTTINIPDDPTKDSIDGTNYHFTGWDKEIPLVISDQNIDFYAQYSEEEFSKGLNFTYVESEDSYIVDKGTVEDIDVIVPATYNNKKVTEIAEYGFSDMINMQTITFGEYVENIGKRAFQNCEKLSSVSGLDNIKTIPEYAFANTSLLEEFEIGENVIIIGSYAFADSGIKVVNIPASVIAIEENAFENCLISAFIVDSNNSNYASKDGDLYNKNYTELILYALGKNQTTFAIPSSVITIENYAFGNNSVSILDSNYQKKNYDLENIIVPISVVNLKEYSLPENVVIFTYFEERPLSWEENCLMTNKIFWNGSWEIQDNIPVTTLSASTFKTGIYSNWMSYIDDDIKFLDVVIPGSHDSGTNGLGNLYKTQNCGYYDQLTGGVRYFDVRVAEYKGTVRSVHANSGVILTGENALGITFQSILDDINLFLSENPEEVIVLDFQHIWNDYTNMVLPMLIENISTDKMLKRSQCSDLSQLTMGQLRQWKINLIIVVNDINDGKPNFDEYDFLFPRSTYLLSPYDSSSHTSGSSSLINHFPTYFAQNDGTKIFVLQSQRTGSMSGWNIIEIEKEFRAIANDYARSLSLEKNEIYLSKTNIIMRDFAVDDIGISTTPQETMQSILFLNVYKNNISHDLLEYYKILLDFNTIDSMSKSY